MIAPTLQGQVIAIDLRNAATKFQHRVQFLRNTPATGAAYTAFRCFFKRFCPMIVRRTRNERVQILNADCSSDRRCDF